MGETAVNWALTCRWCDQSFLSKDAKKTSEGFIVCPACNGWSGMELGKRRASFTLDLPIQDDFAAVTDLWAWLVLDPKTNSEAVVGFMLGGAPRVGVHGSKDEALKMRPHLEAAAAATRKRIRLVRYVMEETAVEI